MTLFMALPAPWGYVVLFFSSVTLVLTLIIVFFDRVEILVGKISAWLGWLSSSYRRSAVSRDLQGRINLALKSLDPSVRQHFPSKVRISWIQAGSNEALPGRDGNELVLVMDYHHNQPRNIATATYLLVEGSLARQTRHYADRDLMRSSDLVMTSRLLEKESVAARSYFMEQMVAPIITTSPEVASWYEQLVRVDRRGLFCTIFLNEIAGVGAKIYPEPPTDDVREEINDFARFLYNLALREIGDEETPTIFTRPRIRVAITFCSRSETLQRAGYDPVVAWALQQFSQSGVDVVYLCAAGSNIKHVKNIADLVDAFSEYKLITDVFHDRLASDGHRNHQATKAKIVRLQLTGSRKSAYIDRITGEPIRREAS